MVKCYVCVSVCSDRERGQEGGKGREKKLGARKRN